jgi:ferredoxin-type protein NapH
MNRRKRVRNGLLIVSFFLFPVTFYYLSPAISLFGAFQGVLTGAVLLFGLQFVSALVLGRAWCGWACPSGGMQEACFRANDRRVAGGHWNWTKFFIWAPWLSFLVFTYVRLGLKRVDPFFMTTYGFSLGSLPGIVTYVPILGLLVLLPALAIGRRAFCHYECWMAPFMIIGRKLGRALLIPTLHMKADSAKCASCGTCTKVCPMSLEVRPMVARGRILSSECINCGACADNCPNRAITFGFGPEK